MAQILYLVALHLQVVAVVVDTTVVNNQLIQVGQAGAELTGLVVVTVILLLQRLVKDLMVGQD
jgi:hypothetical protein